MTTCAREGCGHDRVMHPHAGPCRQPRCTCEAFVAPDPAAEPAEDHPHQWQAAGVMLDGKSIAALCHCGALVRLRVPDEPINA